MSIGKILGGSFEYLRDKELKYLPSKPHWIDVNGDVAAYSGCNYCDFKEVCNEVDSSFNVNLDEFFDKCKKELVKHEECT